MKDFFPDLWDKMYDLVVNNFNKILTFFLFVILGYVAIKVIVTVFRKFLNHSKLKGVAGDFLAAVIKVVLIIVYMIMLLAFLGVPTTSLVALFSAGALAVSLALQTTFSNIAAGIVIVATKLFEEGQYIEIDGVAGTVETITIFSTKLKTPDNKLIVIPNGTVTSSKIINYTANPTRRLEIIFSVAYGTDIEPVKTTVLAVVKKHPEILADPAPTVRLTEQGSSSLNFAMRVWVAQKDYWPVNFDLKEEVLEAFRANGIRIPFPQMDIHLDK